MTAPPPAEGATWKRLIFTGPTLVAGIIVAITATATAVQLITSQDNAIRTVQKVVTEEIAARKEADAQALVVDKETQNILSDIRDEIVNLRLHFVSFKQFATWVENMRRANAGRKAGDPVIWVALNGG